MYTEIITGGIGSDKSSYLYNSISENLKNDPSCNIFLIVPEQFSYTAQKTISDSMGGFGINRLDVIPFSRLCFRYQKLSNSLLPSGKMVLLKKATEDLPEDNIFFLSSKKSGFIDSLSELFSELKRYNITFDDFDSISIDNPLTKRKLDSISTIYKKYTDSLANDFSDNDDELNKFSEFIMGTNIFSNTYFYIDDYNDFMPQHYAVIKALMQKSKGVYLTLSVSETENTELSKPIIKTKNRLISLSKSVGINPVLTTLDKKPTYIIADDIRFLLENWDEMPHYEKKSENISVFNALDLYSEVTHTASEIISLVRDKGYRFRDIGVICGDMEEYLYLLTSVFSDYKIPFFADEKMSVSGHPIAKTVLSLFDIIAENWSYNSVFSYLRSGYIYEKTDSVVTPISQEDVDLLENYVLMHGIKSKKAWFSEWAEKTETVFDDIVENRNKEEFDLTKLNELRLKIITPFKTFLENKGRTVSAIAESIYNFMCDINLYDGLLLECQTFDELGFRDEAEQFRQVWNFIIEVLDQLVIVLGKGAISRESFSEYFSCALSACQISIIPSGIDRVSLGTVSRNSPSRVKVLFVIGAVQGQIPKSVSEGTILSDFDRNLINSALEDREKELAPNNLSRILLENLKLFRTISTATEKLYISCPSSDKDGNAVTCSHFVSEVISMFDITVKDNILSKPSTEELLSSSKNGFCYMLKEIQNFDKQSKNSLWLKVRDWYAQNPEYKDRLDILKNAVLYRKVQPHLSRIKAEMLYGKNKKYSITALEKFEKCPFSYYLEKGLYLTKQEEMKIEKSHIGSLVHAAICDFCHLVEDGETSISKIHEKWQLLTDEKCNELIHIVMENIKEKVLSRATYNKNQLEYLLYRCEITLKKSIETVRKSLSSGNYTSICYEKDFEVQIDWKNDSITLIGTIDRIDVLENIPENKLNIRIVDYKSGNKDFSETAVLDKVDMQLVLYAIAASKMAESGSLTHKTNLTPEISAILYSKIKDPDNEKITESQAHNEENILKVQKMDGLVILNREDNDDETSPLIHNTIMDMDKNFAENQTSDFMSINLKKDGTFSSSSKITSRKNFDIMSKYIRKAVIDADKSLRSGNIDIKPYNCGGKTPCNYCNFKDVCLFDAKLYGYRTNSVADNVYESMEKEIEADE